MHKRLLEPENSQPNQRRRIGSISSMAVDETDDQLPDAPGTRVFYSKYEPREVLGRGVSSTVRRCVHKDTGLEYAVKIIDISAAENGAELRTSTYREVHVLRRVQGHRYIIQLHDMFESDTHLFLVFELLREGELFDYLTTVVALSEKRTRLMMRQLLQALAYLHHQFVVHRDVKPENILLDEDCSTIKLTDFGFARCLQSADADCDPVVESGIDCQLTEVLGTPGYMAPEILRAGLYQDSGGYGRPVDVWAAGVVMYTLLVGCPPFWHRKQMIMLRNIMEGRYSFGSPEWDDITEAPKNLIRRMLCVDPRQRITAAQALKHEFFCGPAACADTEPADGAPIRAPLSPASPAPPPFQARAKFRLAINCARAAIRIQRLKFTPEAIPVRLLTSDPYALRAVRRAVDACAFRIYGHWVKKATGQNRAMLFENECRAELVRGNSDTTHRINVVSY